MAKQTKERKPSTPWSTEKTRLFVPIFQDEYEQQGIHDEMSMSEARAVVRNNAGLAVPVRHTLSGSASGLAKSINSANPELRGRILAMLAEAKKEEPTEESEDTE
jgi:hypothetical protein